MDPIERLLASRLKLVYFKGKRRKYVSTLFTEEVQEAITFFITGKSEYRDS